MHLYAGCRADTVGKSYGKRGCRRHYPAVRGQQEKTTTSPTDSLPSESAHDLDNLDTAVQKPGLEHIIR